MSVPVHSLSCVIFYTWFLYTCTVNWFSVHLYCKPDFLDTSVFFEIPQNKSKSEHITRTFAVLVCLDCADTAMHLSGNTKNLSGVHLSSLNYLDETHWHSSWLQNANIFANNGLCSSHGLRRPRHIGRLAWPGDGEPGDSGAWQACAVCKQNNFHKQISPAWHLPTWANSVCFN